MSHPAVEISLVITSIFIGGWIIGKGYVKHRNKFVMTIFTFSAIVLTAYGIFFHDHSSIMSTIGSVGMVISYLLNWRASH